ncbi:hypothetical protein ACFX13_000624 [Malus domestica]
MVFIFDFEFGSTPKTSLDIKKVHVALGIPYEYREWRWLFIPFCRGKCGLPPREEIKRIKEEALARPIVVLEPAVSEGGKKRSSSPSQEMPIEKKPKISSAAREGLPTAPRLVIDLVCSKSEKDKAARSASVMHVIPKVVSLIADRNVQRRSSDVPLVLKFMLKCLSRAKSGSLLERLTTMKNNKMDSAAKVVPKLTPLAVGTDSLAERRETARVGSCEKYTKPISMEVVEICVLLKPDLLEDMDVCAKFVDDVKGVVCLSSFVKHTIEYRRTVCLL